MSDEMAFGAMSVIRDRRADRIPDDVSVLGFDDHQLAEVLELTTVRQHVERHGAHAARLLLDHLEAGEVNHVEVGTELVVRGSTGRASGAHGVPSRLVGSARRSALDRTPCKRFHLATGTTRGTDKWLK